MNLAVLPLSVTMMAGPQILSALIFVTTKRPIVTSSAFVAGVAIAVTTGVAIATWLAGLVPLGAGLGGTDVGRVVQYVLVAALLAFALKSWVGRRTAEPPQWLEALMSATPRKAFTTGLLLIGLFPSDVIVMLTVGVHLARSKAPFTAALPFLGATVVIAALPLLAYLVFRHRAVETMPKVRDWMNSHSWLITIVACLFFVALILL